jgi:Domain of unknown function (DUF4351)
LVERISTLSLEQLQALGEALLDFDSIANLESWLENLERSRFGEGAMLAALAKQDGGVAG